MVISDAINDAPVNGRSAGSRIAVIDKVVRTLDVLVRSREGLTPSEVAEATGTNRSTAFRLLSSLEHTGMLDRSEGRYVLGVKLLQYGSAVRNSYPVVRVAEHPLTNLRNATRQSVLLAVREGWGARCLMRLAGPEVDVVTWVTGEWMPFHLGAAPQALLAALDDAEIERYLVSDTWKSADRKISAADVWKDVEQTRQRGWAVSRVGVTPGVSSIGCVVRDGFGSVTAAISSAGVEHHYTGVELERTAAALSATATEIHRALQ